MAEKKKKGIGNRVAISIVIVALVAVAVFVPVSEEGSLVANLFKTQEPEPTACILIFAPVCGVNGETFSNSCFAEAEGVEIAHDGECPVGSNTGEMLVSEPASTFCRIYPTASGC